MFIKFIKNYKDYNVGKIICCKNKIAVKLVESGYAQYAGECFRMGDLFVTDTYVLDDVIWDTIPAANRKHNGGKRIVYKTEEFVGDVFSDRTQTVYIQATTNGKIYDCINPNGRYGHHFSNGDVIVRVDSVTPFSTVFKYGMTKQGLTIDDFITKKDLIRLENILNGKTNENVK